MIEGILITLCVVFVLSPCIHATWFDHGSSTEDKVKENQKTKDYNELFADLQKACDEENVLNAFAYISLGELENLNYLLDRLIIFCENVDQEELEDCECGDKVLELYKLADTLFIKNF